MGSTPATSPACRRTSCSARRRRSPASTSATGTARCGSGRPGTPPTWSRRRSRRRRGRCRAAPPTTRRAAWSRTPLAARGPETDSPPAAPSHLPAPQETSRARGRIRADAAEGGNSGPEDDAERDHGVVLVVLQLALETLFLVGGGGGEGRLHGARNRDAEVELGGEVDVRRALVDDTEVEADAPTTTASFATGAAPADAEVGREGAARGLAADGAGVLGHQRRQLGPVAAHQLACRRGDLQAVVVPAAAGADADAGGARMEVGEQQRVAQLELGVVADAGLVVDVVVAVDARSEEDTSELQSH